MAKKLAYARYFWFHGEIRAGRYPNARILAEAWRDRQLVQRTVALIPWRSNLAKYALAGYTKLIGVAGWERQVTESLPENLKSSLPTIEAIEAELSEEENDG